MAKQRFFFSYARADAAFALKMAINLKNAGANVWIDQTDIALGAIWDVEIEKALVACDCLLFVASRASVVSNNTLNEVYYALEENKRVLPIKIDDCKIPFRIQRLHYIDISNDYDKQFARLLHALNLDTESKISEGLLQPVPTNENATDNIKKEQLYYQDTTMKVVFLAFANSQTDPLPTLAKEDREVFSSLVNLSLQGNFKIHRESFATDESINMFMSKYEQIAVFHYSGHAGKQFVQFNEKKIFGTGFTQQLKRSIDNKSLKLVVLNGCSTAEQVKSYLELGAPLVIATSASIIEKTATAFAIRFYHDLAEKGMNIRNAFADALGAAQTTSALNLDIDDKSPRGIDFLSQGDADKPLWGIFYQDAKVLDENPLTA